MLLFYLNATFFRIKVLWCSSLLSYGRLQWWDNIRHHFVQFDWILFLLCGWVYSVVRWLSIRKNYTVIKSYVIIIKLKSVGSIVIQRPHLGYLRSWVKSIRLKKKDHFIDLCSENLLKDATDRVTRALEADQWKKVTGDVTTDMLAATYKATVGTFLGGCL